MLIARLGFGPGQPRAQGRSSKGCHFEGISVSRRWLGLSAELDYVSPAGCARDTVVTRTSYEEAAATSRYRASSTDFKELLNQWQVDISALTQPFTPAGACATIHHRNYPG